MNKRNITGFANPKIAALYQNVPQEEVQKLLDFRKQHPYKQYRVDNIMWSYIDGGEGDKVLLVPAGALNEADVSWRSISHFIDRHSEQYRVIAPSTPTEIKTMGALTDGLVAILAHEGIEKAHVLGGSFGGMTAQVLARRHPHHVKKLILSHTIPPDPERSTQVRKALGWLKWMPHWVLRAIIKQRLGSLSREGIPELDLINAHTQEIIKYRMTKQAFLNGYWRLVDYDSNYNFTPQDLAGWENRILILMAEDDPSTPEERRQTLQTLYPTAKVHVFQGTGHLTALLNQEEYLGMIEEFIRE